MHMKIILALVLILSVVLIIYYLTKSTPKSESKSVIVPDAIGLPNTPSPSPALAPVPTLLPTPVILTPLNRTVSCYEDCDYNGAKYEFNVGEYPFVGQDVNDKISSIQVPSGLEVELYEHGNFGGRSLIIRENERCLIDKNFNDLTSSLKVRML